MARGRCGWGRFRRWFTWGGDRDGVGDKVGAAEMSGVVAVSTSVGRLALQVGDGERISGTSGDGRVDER